VSYDCSGVIEAVMQGTRSHYSAIIREIQTVVFFLFEEVLIKHERREFNREAHNLAKKKNSSLAPGRYMWLDSPPDLHVVPMIIEV
jgi:hypothetical protein